MLTQWRKTAITDSTAIQRKLQVTNYRSCVDSDADQYHPLFEVKCYRRKLKLVGVDLVVVVAAAVVVVSLSSSSWRHVGVPNIISLVHSIFYYYQIKLLLFYYYQIDSQFIQSLTNLSSFSISNCQTP